MRGWSCPAHRLRLIAPADDGPAWPDGLVSREIASPQECHETACPNKTAAAALKAAAPPPDRARTATATAPKDDHQRASGLPRIPNTACPFTGHWGDAPIRPAAQCGYPTSRRGGFSAHAVIGPVRLRNAKQDRAGGEGTVTAERQPDTPNPSPVLKLRPPIHSGQCAGAAPGRAPGRQASEPLEVHFALIIRSKDIFYDHPCCGEINGPWPLIRAGLQNGYAGPSGWLSAM
jgi:hypothetical protein